MQLYEIIIYNHSDITMTISQKRFKFYKVQDSHDINRWTVYYTV